MQLISRRALAVFVAVAVIATIALVWRARQPGVAALLKEAAAADRAGRSDEAVVALDRALRIDPGNSAALLERGRHAFDAGETELALRMWRRVPDEPFRSGGTARFLEGVQHLALSDAEQAEVLFLKSASLHPTFAQPRERLIQLYLVQRRFREVREQLAALRSARALSFDEMLLSLASVNEESMPPEGLPLLEQFVRQNADDLPSRVALAESYAMLDRRAEADTLLRKAVERHPSSFGVNLARAKLLLRQGDLAGARRLLEQQLSSGSEDLEVARFEGLLAFEEGDWPRAALCFSKAVLAASLDRGLSYKLALSLERSGEADSAKVYFLRSASLERLSFLVEQMTRDRQKPAQQLIPAAVETTALLVSLSEFPEAAPWGNWLVNMAPGNQRARALFEEISRHEGDKTQSPPHVDPVQLASRANGNRRTASAGNSGANNDPSRTSPIRLVDLRETMGLDFQYFNGQSGMKYLLETTGGGACACDFDLDGWPDLYFPQGCAIPEDASSEIWIDRLWKNRGGTSFVDVTHSAGFGDPHYSQGCAAGDIDNDGFADLVVANNGASAVYHNNGDGTFSDMTEKTGIRGEHCSSSVALADLDLDGNLDLYVVNYVLDPLRTCRTPEGRLSTCHPANFSGEDDVFYRNQGDGTFLDVTAESQANAPDGKGLGVVIADFDDDGWPDVYVANDGTPNFLFHSLGKSPEGTLRFEEIGIRSGSGLDNAGRAQAGMGIACGDLTESGRLDLFVTNFYRETNSLYVNLGALQFAESSTTAGLGEPSYNVLGFGTQAIDFDRDSHLDLLVANGHIDDYRFRGEPWKMPPQLFRNLGSGAFVDVSQQGGDYFQGEYIGRSVVRVDWNRDDLPDAVVVHQDRPAALLANQSERPGNFVTLELRGVLANRDAVGARIEYVLRGVRRVTQIFGGDGFLASNERRQILGLGDAEAIESLKVIWPGGIEQSWTDVSAGSRWLIVEGREPVALVSLP